MKKTAEISFAIAALAVAAASCNTDGCLDNQNSIPLAGFYSSETGEQTSLAVIDISGVGAPGDSLLLASGTSARQVYLPMRSLYESTAWCFHYTQAGIDSPELNDTIEFRYQSEPYFASEECGAMYRYLITETRYTTHLVDSVVVTDSLITNVDTERIRIYFRTAQEPEETDNQDDEQQ